MYKLEVLNPVAQLRGEVDKGTSLNKRPPTLEGKTIGLVWDGEVNGDVALKRFGELLGARFKGAQTKFYEGDIPVPTPLLERAVAECDVVVLASGD